MKTTSYNLIMSGLYNGRKADRPPVGNPTSIVCQDLMDAGFDAYHFEWLENGSYNENSILTDFQEGKGSHEISSLTRFREQS